MARASSVVSARAMAPGSLTQQRNRTKLADSCSATVAGFYAAVDTLGYNSCFGASLPCAGRGLVSGSPGSAVR